MSWKKKGVTRKTFESKKDLSLQSDQVQNNLDVSHGGGGGDDVEREDSRTHPTTRTGMNLDLGWCLGLSHTAVSKATEEHLWGMSRGNLSPRISLSNTNPAARCFELVKGLGK